jgi:hypothetical protein
VLVADALEINEATLQPGLRVGDRLVVDDRTDFLEAEVEQQLRLQVARLGVDVLD